MSDDREALADLVRVTLESVASSREFRQQTMEERLAEARAEGAAPLIDSFKFSILRSIIAVGARERPLHADLGLAVAQRMADVTSDQSGRAEPRRTVLSIANLLQLMGVDVPDSSMEMGADWLVDMDTAGHEPESTHYSKGFAALALDRPLVYRAVAAVPEDAAPPYDTNSAPGFNNQAWLALFASAVESGISFEEARGRWREFALVYDTLVEIGGVDTSDLAWVARIVRHRIGGAPLASVADWLCAELRFCAGLADEPPE